MTDFSENNEGIRSDLFLMTVDFCVSSIFRILSITLIVIVVIIIVIIIDFMMSNQIIIYHCYFPAITKAKKKQ